MNKMITAACAALIFCSSCNTDIRQEGTSAKREGKVIFLNPEGMHRNPAFSQAVSIDGTAKTIYVGGQNAVDSAGAVVGKGDMEAQARQTLKNLETALAAGGASLENVIQWNVYVVQGQPLEPAYKVFQQAMTGMKSPPIISMAFVAGLANPDYLMEISATAVIAE